MRLSIILIILLLIVVGFLMIYNTLGVRDRAATFSRGMIMAIGIIIFGGGIYLFVKYLLR